MLYDVVVEMLLIPVIFEKNIMGLVVAQIELINGEDMVLARKNFISENEIRRMTVDMLVDSGAYNLCINEVIQVQLQFPVVGKRKGETADGRIVEFDLVDEVQVRFKNRSTTCRAMVLPGNNEPLLGAIPIEDMDVLIHPLKKELIVNPEHPYVAQMKLK